jgi:hypothetical protein
VGKRGFCSWVCLKDIRQARLATNLRSGSPTWGLGLSIPFFILAGFIIISMIIIEYILVKWNFKLKSKFISHDQDM